MTPARVDAKERLRSGSWKPSKPMARVKIANWDRWQTYRADRGQPPWIKLHRKVLRNPDWISLTDAQRGQLVTLWMLAADNNGVIETPGGASFCEDVPNVAKYLSELGHMKPETCHLQVLIDHGFIEKWRQRGVNVASRRRQHDATEVEVEVEVEKRQSTEVEREEVKVLHAAKNGRPRAASTDTWDAFSKAYLNRYGVVPSRNKRVNSQMAQFITRVPLAEAPLIAAFYLGHNDAFYIRSAHSVGIMLRDAEKLRTEWQTGRKVTGQKARQDEQTSTNFENAERAIKLLERRDRERATTE